MDTTDQPNSICHVQHIQMYQLPVTDTKFLSPFVLLHGEVVIHHGNSVDGLLVLTNYRLFLQLCNYQHHIPLGLIETVEHRDLFYLHIGCKDARTFRFTFDNNEKCLDWFGRLLKSSSPPRQLEELFAFFHYVWSKEHGGDDVIAKIEQQKNYTYDEAMFKSEVDRLKFDLHGVWRISSVNKNYKLCGSYPPQLLVPSCITDETLETVAKFRSSRRIPAIVWRHTGNGAVIARSSQPEVGWFGWRSGEDEDLIKAISDACNFDRGPRTMLDKECNLSHSPASVHSEDSNQTQPDIDIQEKKKVLIMDARSYTTAVANRARGGGCECPEYYPSCEIQFMNLANIHSIRKSFHALRQLCSSSADLPNWFSLLEGTRWLQHMSGLIKAAVTLVTAVERDAKPVLVHCSDGWDRTPQIVALAELLLDPYYRTIEGFRILIEREWLAFGHKFADRCGHTTGSEDQNERCPVFLQWLDCVHQLLQQFPCAFQFSHTYLVKLAQHTYSNLFGTFLCNTKQERMERVVDNTFSVWGFLNSVCFINHLYIPVSNLGNSQVLWPQYNVRDLQFWSEVYLGSLETPSNPEFTSGYVMAPNGLSPHHMTKTRSYGDLLNASDGCTNQFRRCSDPSITVDTIKINSLSIDNGDLNGKDATQDTVTTSSTTTTTSTTNCTANTNNKHQLDSLTNGRIVIHPTTSNDENFLANDDCSSDCIYKDADVDINDTTTDSIDKKLTHQLNNNNNNNNSNNNNNKKSTMIVDVDKKRKINKKNLDVLNRRYVNSEDDIDIDDEEDDDDDDDDDDETNVIDKTELLLMDDMNKTLQFQCELEDIIIDADNLMPSSSATTATNNIANLKNTNCNNFESICLINNKDNNVTNVLNNCGEYVNNKSKNNDDSDTECNTDPCESKSENTVCDTFLLDNKKDVMKSVETSTETLVSESIKCSSSPNDINGFEKVSNPDLYSDNNIDYCKLCAQNIKAIQGNNKHGHHQHSSNTSGKTSRYSTPPLYSRAPSANGWDSASMLQLGQCSSSSSSSNNGRNPYYTYHHHHQHHHHHLHHQCILLGDDGLIPLKSDMQDRVWQIKEEHSKKEEALQRELHTYRQALIKQVCHKCNHNEGEKIDDTIENEKNDEILRNFTKFNNRNNMSPRRTPTPPITRMSSVVESICSAGEGQTSAVESLRSDMSWEALEDGSALQAGVPTLWVPDHAVSRCTGCQTEFWLGRRKHHCRNCGRIFCADCSENSTPLPSEHLYNPVRVCTSCYSKIRKDCGEMIPNQCKHTSSSCSNSSNINNSGNNHHHHQQQQQQQQHHQQQQHYSQTNNNPQITASSN